MASSTISSELRISLVEDATKQAPKIAAALERVKKEADTLQKVLAGSGTSDRLQKSLVKLGAGEAHIEGVAKAWRDYAAAEGLAEHAGDWTRQQAAAARSWEEAAIKAVRDVKKEEAALARARHEQTTRAESEAIKAAQHQAAEEKRLAEQSARDTVRAAERAAAEKRQLDRETVREAKRSAESIAREARRVSREEAREERDRLKQVAREQRAADRERKRLEADQARTDNTVAGVASLYVAHRAVHAGESVGERYREYDKERRYGQVVMGLSDEQQRPLVNQAIRGSADSKFNDIEWLKAQRELAARGYNRDQVMGFTPVTAQLGQGLDVSMEEGVKLLEGAMLGFKKDVSSEAAARRSAQRTADLEVKTSKISGAGAEDLIQLYKRGAASAQMAGLTEEQMLAFGGTAKKVNIGGDEAATAFVALTKNLLHPTHEARTAMTAAGIDFSKYQKIGPVNEEGFASEVARNYGVKLKSGVRAGLHRIFSDPDLMKDPAKRTPAIMRLLRRDLHGNDAKSMKSIAGLAGRYVDDSATGVDTQGLLKAIMAGIAKNPALSNTIFGSKQGGRIAAALAPETFDRLLDILQNHSEGTAAKVSEARMAGFDGELSKLTNQIAIFETSMGRAFDNDGRGGMLTEGTRAVRKFVEVLGEANPRLLRAGGEAVMLAGAFAALKSVDFLRGGFGLKTSASALTTSAELLDQAAIKLGATAAAKGEAAAAGAAAGAAAEPAAAAAAEIPKPKGFLGEGGLKSIPKKIMLGGPAAIAEYLAYQAGTGAIETVTDALPHPKYRDGYDPAQVRERSAWGDAKALWAHLRGQRTPEELAAKKAAEAPLPVPAVAPKAESDDDAADDAAEDKKDPAARAERAASPFLARHSDFRDASPAEDTPAIAGKRASGGPVSRGKTYLVGEHGPELFTAGMNGAISTADVQRLLSRASYHPAEGGDGETAKAVRALGFELAGSVDGVARAVDRLDARKLAGVPGQDGYDGGGSTGGVTHGGGGGGRRGFMGRMPDGHYGGRRGVGGGGDGKPLTGERGAFAGDYKDNPAIRAYITDSAKARGIDPAVALKVWGHEGHAGYVGDGNSSFGPFQLHYGGINPKMPHAGMGDDFTKATGLDARDHSTIRQQVDFALNHVRRHGWGAWMGAKAEGIHGFQGVGPMPGADPGISKDRTALDHPDATASPAPVGANGEKIVGGANLMSSGHYAGARPGADLTTITTEDGRRLTVHKDAAPSFKRFIDQLETRGYKVNSLGGYAARGNRSDPSRLSEHAFGNAIDINPSTNPFRSDKTDMPADVSRMAAENGLSWGGDWRHKDNMHFEWRGVRPWEKAEAAARKKAATKPIGEAPTKEDLNRSNEEVYRSPQNPFMHSRNNPLGLKREAKPAGEELHAGLTGLHGKTIKPDVDISGIHEAEAAVDRLHEKLGRVHTASAKAGRKSQDSAKVAGLSSKLRGGYMSSGSQIG